MNKILETVDSVIYSTGKAVSFIVWAGAIVLFIEVVSRYVFNSPTVWAHGYTQRIFGSYFILMGAFTLVRGGHVRIDLVFQKFSPRVQAMFDLLNYGMLLIWCSVLIIESWTFFSNSWAIKEVDQMVLGHPVYPVKFILFIGAVMMGIQGLSMLFQAIIKIKEGK